MMRRFGTVALVGAGPGDPELLTVRGLNRLRSAEVVVYDRLIDPRLLAEIPADAECIFAGKASGSVVMSQRAIESILVDRARAGKRVVRLKGGDPFVFGRGAEEVEALTAAGIACEVVPGITSAIAVPAAAGIPVTHRGLASSVTIVTGHEDPDKPDGTIDWELLGRGRGTLVVLMGLERLHSIADRLLTGGRPAGTPAAIISAGTWAQQRTVTAPLAEIASRASADNLPSPAVIVVGEVAAFPAALAALAGSSLAEAV